MVFFLQNEPRKPPSIAELKRKQEEEKCSESPKDVYFASLKDLLSNKERVKKKFKKNSEIFRFCSL